jgi:diphthamide biosynthesis protein 7
MHAGARIVRVQADDGGNWTVEVLAKFEEHKSMNYGSDVQPEEGGNSRQRTIVSTSFYDKLLCLWRF